VTLTDSSLIDSIVGENAKKRFSAFEVLYKQNFNSIQSFVIKNHGTKDEAKDIFQDAMIIVYRNLVNKSFKEDSKLSTYLFSICKNLWFQRIRKLKIVEFQSVDVAENLSENFEITKVDSSLLNELLDKLKSDCKQLLIAFYYERKPMRDLMEIFKLGSEQAAKTKKLRCLNGLIDLVREKRMTQQSFFV
jgi:RNA polymerase sigma factor (sigma-70 family)